MEHPISQRIKIIIERESNGKFVEFAKQLQGIPYQVITRLFKKDPRNGKYPTPSTDLILEIINRFISYNPTWILTGEGLMLKDAQYDNEQQSTEDIKSGDYTEGYWRGRYDELLEKHKELIQELAHIKSTTSKSTDPNASGMA